MHHTNSNQTNQQHQHNRLDFIACLQIADVLISLVSSRKHGEQGAV